MTPKVMMHKETGELVEMTHSWFGFLIWLVDHETIAPNRTPTLGEVIFSDDARFKNYVEIGEC